MVDAPLEQEIRSALERGEVDQALTLAVRGYGPQIASYLRTVMKSEADASEAFSIFCEFLWKGLPQFRGESSVLTWAHKLAWGAVRRHGEDSFRRRADRLSTTAAGRLAAEVFATSPRKELEDRLAALRAQLDPEEQTLLVLRLDRRMPWREIAQVMGDVDEPALRKRFERLKRRIRELAKEQGLLS
jgi:RNA polymerase sigma-70 factor (ECF subfamily)